MSSTSKDLAAHRAAVLAALRRMQLEPVGMEDWTSDPATPLEVCLEHVGQCRAYIGVFAWRYGFIPPGQLSSITELELRKAQELGLPVLVFLLADDHPWPLTNVDDDRSAVERLREDLKLRYSVDFFSDPADLSAKVATAVSNLLARLAPASRTEEDRDAAGVGLALKVIAEKVLALVEHATRTQPPGTALRAEFQRALASAIRRYATSGGRPELAQALIENGGRWLAEEAVGEELGQLVLFTREPNVGVLAERWKAHAPVALADCDFAAESALLVRYLKEALKSSDAYRPAFEAGDVRVLARHVAVEESLDRSEGALDGLHGLLRSQFGQLLRQFAAAQPGVRDNIRNQSDLIEEKTRDFVGRRFAIDRIDEFLARAENGYYFVCGEPGIGKSALAAALVKARGYLHHFNVRAEGVNTAAAFLQNVCAQLIVRYGLDYRALPPGATEDAGFLRRLLSEAADRRADREPVVLVVDALDEVEPVGRLAPSNLLYLTTTLPKGVFVIATARDPDRLGLRIECAQDSYHIDPSEPGNRADVREYLERVSGRPGVVRYRLERGVTADQFVEALERLSGCNFMYLHYVVPEIEAGRYRSTEVAALPAGLRNYYEDHWQRMKGEDEEEWFRYQLPIVMALTAVREPISIERVGQFSGVAERARVRLVLAKWSQFLCVDRVEVGGVTEKRYRIYHQSFQDFIAEKEEVKDEAVSRAAAHRKIADRMLEELFGDE